MSFKQFLLESGKATAAYSTARATASDIRAALKFVSRVLDIPYRDLQDDLLGSTSITLSGQKEDSGDIDIAFSMEQSDIDSTNKKMLDAVNGEGKYNAGTRVGSYAVPVNGKKVQVDLMFVRNKDWAKFSYHSSQGIDSKYPGAVRNIILATALAHTQEPGKDFVMRDADGKVIARASKSIKLDTGMQRLFKMAKFNPKTGKYSSTLEKVNPEDLEKFLKDMGKYINFSHREETTDNPDDVAEFIFGKGVSARDIMTAENVIKHIKKLKNSTEILSASREQLEKNKLPVPSEL